MIKGSILAFRTAGARREKSKERHAIELPRLLFSHIPRESIYTTIMELGSQNHNGDGLLGLNSIIAVYMDPLGLRWDAQTKVGLINAKQTLPPSSQAQTSFLEPSNTP